MYKLFNKARSSLYKAKDVDGEESSCVEGKCGRYMSKSGKVQPCCCSINFISRDCITG